MFNFKLLRKMQNIKFKSYLAIVVLTMTLFSSCDFTESDMLAFKKEEDVLRNMANITSTINNVYSYLPDGYDRIGTSMLAAACDEAEDVNDMESIQNFNSGNWNAFSNPEGNVWTRNYNGIRKANVFLDLLEKVDWTYLKVGTPDEYARREKLTKMHRYEAHFLRAFFYFELIKRYGGVPLVTRAYDPFIDADTLKSMPRADFAKCVDYIVMQCDTAAKYLEPDYNTTANNAHIGRATKGAAMALKARTLLYAASNLFNRPGNTRPELGYTDDNRKDRWILAAKAAKAVLDMSPSIYGSHNDYSALFNLGDVVSKEVIFEKRFGSTNNFETLNYPVGFATGRTSTCPTQNLIDAYEMKFPSTSDPRNGKFWDDLNSGYNPLKPYDNRDPRLKKTIVCNGEKFGKDNVVVECWEGGAQGLPRKSASKTGYYLRKHINETLDLTLSTGTAKKQWIYFRFSEMNLNYAEAMFEAFGSPTLTSATDGLTVSALTAINSVRTRPAVSLVALKTTITTDEFKKKLRSERQVELAFEDHRYWDVRRWMIAEEAIGGEIYGMRIVKTADNVYTYTRQKIETRVWSDKMYLYPIPQSEVNKSTAVKPNPGWE